MDPDHLNLRALDPTADAERWERLVTAITESARPELARRAAPRSPLLILAGWARPMLSAAALLAGISLVALRAERHPADSTPPPYTAGMLEALQVPSPISAWLAEERAPTVDDLILVLDGELR